jgi:hypothetical protein
MSIEHLSDEEIQAFINSESSSIKDSWRKHLESCLHCRNQLALYTMIDNEISSQLSEDFSDNFEHSTMNNIQLRENRVFHLKDYLVFIFTTVFGLGLLAYCFLSERLRSIIIQSFSRSWEIINDFTSSVICVDKKGSGCTELLLACLIIIFTFYLLEKTTLILKRSK